MEPQIRGVRDTYETYPEMHIGVSVYLLRLDEGAFPQRVVHARCWRGAGSY